MIYREVRRSELCRGGGETGAKRCPDARRVTCAACHFSRTVEDTNYIEDPCPNCGGEYIDFERCDSCPLTDLEYVRGHSRAGQMLNRILELDWCVKHLKVDWRDINAEEVRGLQVLEEERNRFRQEEEERRNPQHGI